MDFVNVDPQFPYEPPRQSYTLYFYVFAGVIILILLVLIFYYVTKKKEAPIPEKIPMYYPQFMPRPPTVAEAPKPPVPEPVPKPEPAPAPAPPAQEFTTNVLPDDDPDDVHVGGYDPTQDKTPIMEEMDTELDRNDYPYHEESSL